MHLLPTLAAKDVGDFLDDLSFLDCSISLQWAASRKIFFITSSIFVRVINQKKFQISEGNIFEAGKTFQLLQVKFFLVFK